ncbi:DUF3221 domain-containing protein [Bacillus zhangzhouensis]
MVTTLTLGYGFTLGVTPAFADSNTVPTNNNPISSIQSPEQIFFSGYVISVDVDSGYIVVADTSTKEEALSYQDDWSELVFQKRILRVPVSGNENFILGEKLNVVSIGWTASLPPIAVMPTIEKIEE